MGTDALFLNAFSRDDDRKDPEVIGYLEAENEYTKTQTAHLTAPAQDIYDVSRRPRTE